MDILDLYRQYAIHYADLVAAIGTRPKAGSTVTARFAPAAPGCILAIASTSVTGVAGVAASTRGPGRWLPFAISARSRRAAQLAALARPRSRPAAASRCLIKAHQDRPLSASDRHLAAAAKPSALPRRPGFDPDQIAAKWFVASTGPVAMLKRNDYANRLFIPIFWATARSAFRRATRPMAAQVKYKACLPAFKGDAS